MIQPQRQRLSSSTRRNTLIYLACHGRTWTTESASPGEREFGRNFKGGFGPDPLGSWLDNTNEALAILLRPGNAGR